MSRQELFDPRELMERAVAVMRESVAEGRDDGKACPKVGAVLVKADGSVETAYRGELREGDHAEFTLVERKNRDVRLDGAALFVTLEPCAPGARHFPKLGCAERIVHARIGRVWVGIEDPDPLVARKGIQHLLDAGLEIHMFDPDLQQAIRDENEAFLAQATERAEAVGLEPERIVLSQLEGTLPYVEIEDLSSEALAAFRTAVGIEGEEGSLSFHRDLARLGLLKEEDGGFLPTGFGFILFGKQPRTALPQAALLGTIHYPDDTQEIRDFDGPQALVPDQAIGWLRDKLPNPIDRSEARRREINAPLYELAREGIVNALVHRDYGIAGAKCQLAVTPETIAVWSPGPPVPPVTLEQMQAFSAPMLSRNPILHYVFAQLQLAEERGMGLRSLRDRARQLGLPRPRYTWNNPYLVLTLYRHPESATRELPKETLAQLDSDERAVWQLAVTRDSFTTRDIMDELALDERKVQRVLKSLVNAGLLRRFGRARATHYEAVRT